MNLNEWFYFSCMKEKLALDGNYCPQGKHVVKCSPVLTCPNWWTSVKWITNVNINTVCWRGIIKAKGCFKKKKVQRRGSFFILDFNRVKNNISSTDVAWVRSPWCRRCHCSAPLPLRQHVGKPGSRFTLQAGWMKNCVKTAWLPCENRIAGRLSQRLQLVSAAAWSTHTIPGTSRVSGSAGLVGREAPVREQERGGKWWGS